MGLHDLIKHTLSQLVIPFLLLRGNWNHAKKSATQANLRDIQASHSEIITACMLKSISNRLEYIKQSDYNVIVLV